MIGFYGPYPKTEYQLHFYIEGSVVTAGILFPLDLEVAPYSTMSYEHYLAWIQEGTQEYSKAGYPNNFTNDTFVKGIPGHDPEQWFQVRGKISFDLTYATGVDEITDFSIVDLNINNDGTFAGIHNRFARTKNDKVVKSHRARAMINVTTVATFVFPFASSTFNDAELIIIPFGEGGEPIGIIPDFRRTAQPPGERLITDMYSPKFDVPVIQVTPEELIEIPFVTTWNGGHEYPHSAGEPINQPVKYTVEATSGYAPVRRVETDNQGNGKVRFRASDLLPGDKAKIKLNIGHFSNIGHIDIEVI